MLITVHTSEEILEATAIHSWRWMLFKHSDTCPISTTAMNQVEEMLSTHPEVTVLMLEVKSQRDLSNRIEQEYDTIHESPQILMFKWKDLKEVKNHLAISARWLTHVVDGGYAG